MSKIFTWKGWIFCFTRSYATSSQSSTNDVMDGLFNLQSDGKMLVSTVQNKYNVSVYRSQRSSQNNKQEDISYNMYRQKSITLRIK